MNIKTPTKQKLLEVLKKNDENSINDIMQHFSISDIAVRKHIHELVQQGFVKKIAHKKKVGRPYFTYELTEKGHETFPNQNKDLPVELLHDLEDLQGPEAVKELLLKRMKRETTEYEERMRSETLDGKIAELASIQNEKGYMLEVEKIDKNQYEIRNYNCPIANISTLYSQVCHNEKSMLQKLFSGSEVATHSLITDGSHLCRWTITDKGKDS
ncbi:helix-turn-helix transcriptional regulator [Oceanobacillus bengalensis]|uniref:DeoR family transcriptional regulator n=1 Tax=Oceanobacillus bengalensis TaxID=1435466 RepID=A0A494YWB4_9BACI|nr:DeoR family transcriptional regulator [Oceanobacillus bengalensis]RKQ14479.1 DeoR family transcriptional regulator [Oceanobacillus bengalensis]